MQLLKISIAGLALVLSFGSCNNEKGTTKEKNEKEVVKQSPVKAEQVAVYYFHSTRRCATCQAIERVSRSAVKNFFEGNIRFVSYNIEEEDGAAKAKEVNVKSSALVIMRDGEKIDITDEAFMNARSNPQKLKALIKEKIEPLKKS
ncbi:hypothetical protein L21SP5_02568 [Salinivirga cyanobacteriivorans]|uniref:Thioredoxin n=1 Tax=Salinivirga cyanobacteriivorans TaxID=1307839 RepID=A0A0S2I1K6_9BACT|nr:nitrophenyl compound nitroreductase subunit ArsF family protein [Salinivirga cyanobacteriivorans]ALO16191.1 hypothetical protein L21SP5_02568 [Salinivirga cyanobacteriivorans]